MKHASFIHRIGAMGLALTITSFAAADELVPATSEDLAQFDRQLANQTQMAGKSHGPAMQNFGKKISAEAHKLNSQDPTQMKKFGKWTKGQRQQDDRGRGGGGLPGMDRERSGSTSPGMPTNGSAFPGHSGRHHDRDDRNKKKD